MSNKKWIIGSQNEFVGTMLRFGVILDYYTTKGVYESEDISIIDESHLAERFEQEASKKLEEGVIYGYAILKVKSWTDRSTIIEDGEDCQVYIYTKDVQKIITLSTRNIPALLNRFNETLASL